MDSEAGCGAQSTRDPVCGMTVSAHSAYSLVHQGKPVYFCGSGCSSKFATDPERYLAPIAASGAARAASAPPSARLPGSGGTIYTCPMHPIGRGN
jgi:Cu+-exporting ATPase